MTPTVAAGIAIAVMALLWLAVAVLIELDRQHEREWAAEAPEWTPPPIEDYRAEGECWDTPLFDATRENQARRGAETWDDEWERANGGGAA